MIVQLIVLFLNIFYYFKEWGDSDARAYYHSLRRYEDNHIREDATPESIRQGYDILCDNYSPSFRFFFLEYFHSSMEAWHTARTKYTRSCAVSSIVGHILGIGDRHTSNIMVHTKTGEIVHIDFGIVFEQGKVCLNVNVVVCRLKLMLLILFILVDIANTRISTLPSNSRYS